MVDSATGTIVQRLDYDSFGNVLLDTAPGFQPFGFQSGLYDPDTALVQFGARWYDASSGRWLSKDPILLEGGFNLYVFCGNDPVNFADPWGLCEEEDSGIGFWDGVQGALDAGGIFEPTPFCDLTSAAISMFRGNWSDAKWSLLGVIPYAGDLGKVGKYGGKALKYGDEANALVKGTRQVSGGVTSAENALRQGEKWLGSGYKEIAPGVFRSADNTKQFRMTTGDLLDPKQGQHVHFESIGADGRTILENSHVGIQ